MGKLLEAWRSGAEQANVTNANAMIEPGKHTMKFYSIAVEDQKDTPILECCLAVVVVVVRKERRRGRVPR